MVKDCLKSLCAGCQIKPARPLFQSVCHPAKTDFLTEMRFRLLSLWHIKQTDECQNGINAMKTPAGNPSIQFFSDKPACGRGQNTACGLATCFFAGILFLLIGVTPYTVEAQPDSLRLLLSLPVEARYAVADHLSNVYVVTTDNALEKYTADGRLLARYSNNRLGQAALLDVSNPLKVMVWYADSRTALFLDRSLTALGELSLINAGYPDVRVVAASQDGNIWVYDDANFRLLKIGPDGEKKYESQAMNMSGQAPRAFDCLREYNDQVFLADSTQGVFIFDAFAQFNRLFVPLQPVKNFQVVDDQIHYLSGTQLIEERIQVRADREIEVSQQILSAGRIILSPFRLVAIRKEKVEIYGY